MQCLRGRKGHASYRVAEIRGVLRMGRSAESLPRCRTDFAKNCLLNCAGDYTPVSEGSQVKFWLQYDYVHDSATVLGSGFEAELRKPATTLKKC